MKRAIAAALLLCFAAPFAQADVFNITPIPLPLAIASGGTGTATPGLVGGTNVTITGSWPNQTITSSAGGSSVSVTAGTPNIVITPTPGTGTFTVGNTQPIKDISSAGTAILTGDNTGLDKLGAFTYTLAQAGTTGFLAGWGVAVQNFGATNSTITTTTSTFTGLGNTPSSTLVLAPGAWAIITSDGTNYIVDSTKNYVSGTNITLTNNTDGTTTIAASGVGGSSTIVAPQGRLTLASGAPVMTSDQTAKATVFYDNYVGNQVPYYTGTADALDTIASGQVSLTMIATAASTGEINASDVFDVWWVHSGANRICIATDGGASANGAGWLSASNAASITARSTTTGFNALDFTSRPYITNKNALTHCYNGATDYGSVSANQATYLGSIYTTAAGQTGMAFTPASAAGGSNAFLALYNAYNHVSILSQSADSTSFWTYGTAAWRSADASNSNRISWLDGLARSAIRTDYSSRAQTSGNVGGYIAVGIDTTSTPLSGVQAGIPGNTGGLQINVDSIVQSPPVMGLHFAQALEFGGTSPDVEFLGGGGSVLFLQLDD